MWRCCYLLPLILSASSLPAADAPQYNRDVAPILTKYCTACHNADDKEGKLSLESFDAVMLGGANGAVVTPRSGEQSRLIRVLNGATKPVMPPKDNDAPTAAEIAILKAWIDAGAPGPSGKSPDPTIVVTPKIKPTVPVRSAINALAVNARGDIAALARFGEVELIDVASGESIRKLPGHRGRVSAVAFSADNRWLLTGAGEAGLIGEAKLWDVTSGDCLKTWQAHRDCIYAVAISPDGKLLATGGYDQTIKLWSLERDEPLKIIEGHNGAVFSLAFRKDGRVLASASEDRTVKLWDPTSGARLDTLNQSTKELYTLAFSPDGQRLAAAGVDNRIRVWSIGETVKEGANPLLFSQFAHEAAVLRLTFSPDGASLISTGEDRLVKVWNARQLTLQSTMERQVEWVSGLAVIGENQQLLVTRLDGTTAKYPLGTSNANTTADLIPLPETPPAIDYGPQPTLEQLPKIAEREPNDSPQQAAVLSLPGIAQGAIHATDASRSADVDLFRFTAKAGEQWIFETNAARSGSQLDSKLEILYVDGLPVPRLLLRAVRDSEIEFRGLNSDQRGIRLKFWDEIALRQYIYLGGEVCKQYQQRRGPDADSQFYPEGGSRLTFFDTTARAHALAEPSYVVVPYAIDTKLPNNGLPVFTVNFENDDDAQRKLGRDSRLTFVAPKDGDYLVRVSDVRGFQGEKFTYQLIARRPQPNFKVTLTGANPQVAAGSGKIIVARVDRIDNFAGPVSVEISNLPPGFTATSPLVIEAGHFEAKGVIAALPHAPATSEANWNQTKVVATADVAGKQLSQEVNNLGTIKLVDRPKVLVQLLPTEKSPLEELTIKQREFSVLEPIEFKSSGGATLRKLADHSVLASGTNPDADTYTVVIETAAKNLTALRLELLGDDSLPDKAPGRAPGNGNFVLSEFSLTAASKSEPAKATPINFASATVDYAQPGFSGPALIDGNASTGWAIADPGPNNTYPVKRRDGNPAHAAVFEFAEPLSFAEGTLLTCTLTQAGNVKQHNVGRFRLSATTEPLVTPPLTFPAIPEVTLVPGEEATCRLKVQRHGFKARIPVEIENLPHGVIVNDIGLNGVLINEQETERVIYLACEPWVAEQDRLFVAVAKVEGDQVSLPMLLHIRKKSPQR